MQNCYVKSSRCFTSGIVQRIIAFEMPCNPSGIQLIMPNPANGLILQYGDPSCYSFDGVNYVQFPRFYFALPSVSRKSMLLKCNGYYRALLVIFRPGVIGEAFKFPLCNCSNSLIVDARHIVPKVLYGRVEAIMGSRYDVDAKISKLVQFFHYIWNSGIDSSLSIQAINRIVASRGVISPTDLSKQLGCSLRTLERRFLCEQGVSPYVYCRLVKHHAILREIHTNTSVDWFDIVVRYQFHDRAHYINDFKKMTGVGSLIHSGYGLQLDENTRIDF